MLLNALARALLGRRDRDVAAGKAFRHLEPGRLYCLVRSLEDYDGRLFLPGERWRYRDYSFLPYEDGLTLFFDGTGGAAVELRLQGRPETQGAIIDALDTVFVDVEKCVRFAFASLVAITEEGLVMFDGVERQTIEWTRITRITAQMGRQQYDMTRCVTIDHSGGKSLFVPEVDPLWNAMLSALAIHLPSCRPAQIWQAALSRDIDGSVLMYRRGVIF